VPSNLSSSSFTSRRITSETSMLWLEERAAPSKRSGSTSERNSWKSSFLPLWGVAVRSRKLREISESSRPRLNRLVYLISPPQTVADILCASSQTIRSQSVMRSFSCKASLRDSLSSRAMQKFISVKMLPLTADSMRSFVSTSNRRWNLRNSSSCHCSARLPGVTIRQRFKSPRAISSLMNRPVMMVLPAPGSSARMYRSGRRGSIS